MPNEIGLLIDGREFGGWKQASVTVSMESGSGSFELAVSEHFPLEPERREIKPAQRCELRIGSDVLVTGYVDEVDIELEDSSHGVRVRGRDAVADLIDCAPNIDSTAQGARRSRVVPGDWLNISLPELIIELAAPFGIPVSFAVSDDERVGFQQRLQQRFDKITLNPGQRLFDLIEQQCRYRQVLPISDGRGGLRITHAGSERVATPLVEGQNIRRANITRSTAERYGRYYVKGQGADYDTQGAEAGEAKGSATDSEIPRHRPLLIVADKAVDIGQCDDRARWEALTRKARGARLSIDVAGWRQPGGALWPLNALVPVRSPTLGVDGEFLITTVRYSLPSSITSLSLMPPDAFRPSPEREVSEGDADVADAEASDA